MVPAGGLVLTCGVDIQRDRIEAEIVAWGRGKESWSVDYRVLQGDTSRGGSLVAVDRSSRGGASLTAGGMNLHILRMAVDSGYATQEVYAWTRSQGTERVLAVKGVDQAAVTPIGQPTAVGTADLGRKEGQSRHQGLAGFHGNPEVRTLWMASASNGWPTDESGDPYPAGYCHFPKYQEEYFKQLTAEQLVQRVVKGYRRPEWQKTRERNESLDCRVSARAAAAAAGLDRAQEQDWRKVEMQVTPKQVDSQQPNPQIQQNHPVREPWIQRRPIRWRFDG